MKPNAKVDYYKSSFGKKKKKLHQYGENGFLINGSSFIC